MICLSPPPFCLCLETLINEGGSFFCKGQEKKDQHDQCQQERNQDPAEVAQYETSARCEDAATDAGQESPRGLMRVAQLPAQLAG